MRKADAPDAGPMAVIHALAFERPWSVDTFEGFLGSEGVAGLIEDEQAFILWRSAAEEAEILTLGVAPAARRQGLARALLDEALAQTKAAGAVEMFLEVSSRNAAAVTLYLAAGFTITGLRKGYYETTGEPEDALTMRLPLTAAPAPTISDGDSPPFRS